MPCNSNYMEPTGAEKNSKLVCQLIVFVMTRLGFKADDIPSWAKKGAIYSYGDIDRLNEGVVMLCQLCTNMTPAQQDVIIYNGRDATSRKLAAWWDEHQAADKSRLAKEAEEKNNQALVASALAKLSPAEKRALDIAIAKNRSLNSGNS